MPKLLHIITGLHTGGAEMMLFKIVSAMDRQRFPAHVLSLMSGGPLADRIAGLGVAVDSLGMTAGLPGPAALYRLRRLVRKLRPDIIQGWMYHGNLAATAVGWMAANRPAIAWNIRHTLYGLADEKPMTRRVIRANRWLSGGPSAILYNSRLSREQHEAFGFASSRGRVIPNGFDVEQFRPDPEKGLAVRGELGIPAEARVVGHIARYHPMKGHAVFLRAAARVAKDHPDVRFLLVGRDVGPNHPALAGIVPKEMEDRFVFLGERTDAPDLMQAMDVFCLSSAWGEAFPNVLGEAMATGVPCVAADVGDSADIVADTGLIVPPGEDGALAEGLMAMLTKPDDERRALGLAARARIENHYALPRIADRYAALYEELAGSRQ